MIKTLATGLTLCAVMQGSAAIFDFELQGRAGAGLLPQNEALTQNFTAASGQAVGPIQYNTDTHELTFTINFDNLSAPLTAAAIHGPADFLTGGASQLYDLSGSYLNQPNNQTSGTLASPGPSGALTLTANPNGTGYSIAQQEAQLNAGQWYIEIASAGTYSMGEIRGNLVPVPEPAAYMAVTGCALAGLALFRSVRRGTGNR